MVEDDLADHQLQELSSSSHKGKYTAVGTEGGSKGKMKDEKCIQVFPVMANVSLA